MGLLDVVLELPVPDSGEFFCYLSPGCTCTASHSVFQPPLDHVDIESVYQEKVAPAYRSSSRQPPGEMGRSHHLNVKRFLSLAPTGPGDNLHEQSEVRLVFGDEVVETESIGGVESSDCCAHMVNP